MYHVPADLFRIEKRGYIREGYFADLVLVNANDSWVVSPSDILYICGRSPFEGIEFSHKVHSTFVNGHPVYSKNTISDEFKSKRIAFKL